MELEQSFATPEVDVRQVVTGPLENNVYFVRCTTTGQAIMIDAPGGDPSLLIELGRKFEITTALVTHGHQDHVGAIPYLRNAGIRVGIGTADTAMTSETDFSIVDGQTFTVGNVELTAVSTPGHTPGSTCFVTKGVLFSGDTLFPGGPGATRPPLGNFETIMQSIEKKLFTLDESTVVLPGHGSSTTIGAEKPSFDEWLRRGW